jgi:hypothetical protein
VVVVIHGVGRRDPAAFRSQVETLETALGIDAQFVAAFWGDILRPDDRVDAILPYREWAEGSDPDDEPAQSSSPPGGPLDLDATIDRIAEQLHQRSEDSRHKILAGLYGLVHDQYVSASAQFTGDLIYYHRHSDELRHRVWDVLEREAPGAGRAGSPVSVIAHSLGSAIAFDMAVTEHDRLHIDHLFTCATQTPFFHVIGCSPTGLDPDSTGEPAQLPASIASWKNFFVALDPWAYLASPVFTLADNTKPEDIEVRSGRRGDRIATHAASHYWSHATVIDKIRAALGTAT